MNKQGMVVRSGLVVLVSILLLDLLCMVPVQVFAQAQDKDRNTDFVAALQGPSRAPFAGNYQIFSFNNLGMHCYDSDFSIFSILPLFNVVHAQVIQRGSTPGFLNNTAAKVLYSAIADSTGSINRTSVNKTNFWTYCPQLFGVTLPADEGLLGAKMPGQGNTPQPFGSFDPAMHWFTASGIPITSYDDNSQFNPYPLMNIQGVSQANGSALSSLSVVLPVSDEMHCSNCHASGSPAADAATGARYGITQWSSSTDAKIQFRENILILHDGKHATNLLNSRPVLCASCHYSAALDLNGVGPQGSQVGKPQFSHAVHRRHGKTVDGTFPDATHPAVIPDSAGSCYNCHPGSVTQCLRGAMGTAGIQCQDCHGGMLAVGGQYPLTSTGQARRPWVDLPKCQSCHTGDALNHRGGAIRSRIAYNPNDPASTPLLAANKRFAEGDITLYRQSAGHGGMACGSCHGSPHAEWPVGNAQANDNVAAVQIQGHSGPIIECAACHTSLPLTMNGPHGMHTVNDPAWVDGHDNFVESDISQCQTCHGLRLEGTVLSRAADNRTIATEDGTVSITKGTAIGCGTCHNNPMRTANNISISLNPACGAVGVPVTITASSPGTGQFYRYWVNNVSYCTSATPSWQLIKDWSTDTTATWTPPAAGRYTVVVWVSPSTTTTCPEQVGATYGVGDMDCIDPVEVSFIPASGAAGQANTFRAMGAESNLQYSFWVSTADVCAGQSHAWVMLQNWSAANTCTYAPPGAGTYTIVVNTSKDPANNPCYGMGGMTYSAR